jgi:hypothetical protein
MLIVNKRNRDQKELSPLPWNYLFKYDSKPLCFENWIKSGILYTKDMFDNNRNFYSIEHFYNILERKNNILCEYISVRVNFIVVYLRVTSLVITSSVILCISMYTFL